MLKSIITLTVLVQFCIAISLDNESNGFPKVDELVCLPLNDTDCKEYLFATTLSLDWNGARTYCLSLEGLVGFKMDLTAIETKRENDAIVSFITENHNGTRFWTSGNDMALEGEFVWASTGYAFSYFNWQPGQPDNNNNNEDAVLIGYANGQIGWNDVAATSLHEPLCEKVGIQ